MNNNKYVKSKNSWFDKKKNKSQHKILEHFLNTKVMI